MFGYAAVSLVIALISAFFGFSGVASGAVEFARIMFYIFLIVGVVSFVIGMVGRRM